MNSEKDWLLSRPWPIMGLFGLSFVAVGALLMHWYAQSEQGEVVRPGFDPVSLVFVFGGFMAMTGVMTLCAVYDKVSGPVLWSLTAASAATFAVVALAQVSGRLNIREMEEWTFFVANGLPVLLTAVGIYRLTGRRCFPQLARRD